jgi:hypothetical protein
MIPRWTPGQWLLRVVIVLAPLAAVLAALPAGGRPHAPFLVALVLVSALFALFPASLAGVLVLLMPAVWWAVVPDPMHPMCLVAAALLLVCHLAALLASYGPDRLPLDPALAGLWARRGVLLVLAAPVVWVTASVLDGERERPGMWVAGLVAACLGAAFATVVFAEGPGPGDPERFVEPL